MDDSSIVIIGANGQLGRALQVRYPNAKAVDSKELDITDAQQVANFNWKGVTAILNAAAYTNVDGAETSEGRIAAWNVNAHAVGNLSRIAQEHKIILVHVSSDYVFDGTEAPHTEDESFSPLSVYGASKAAGDLVAAQSPEHYILRTSWVIGEGKNFVRIMLDLASRGINPSVVSDQIGRLTFTDELVSAIDHLLTSKATFGIYNVTNAGEPASWADITRTIFIEAQVANTVSDVTTADYYAGKEGIAPRPLQSELDLSKLQATGFISHDWKEDLHKYVQKELSK